MRTILKDIANIQTGVFAKPTQNGEIVYLQAKHFDENGEITETLYPNLKIENKKIEKHLLNKGDVLFAAKGTKNFAAWYNNNEIHAVASTTFFVIRLRNKNVLPGYLMWFLNHPNTQLLLKKHAKGSSITSIPKIALSDLEILVPDIKTQKIILKIQTPRNKERKLRQQIEHLKEKEIQQQLFNAIK